DLDESSRNERSKRVLAVPETVGDAGCDRDDVLRRAAYLYPAHVGVRVDTERRCMEQALQGARARRVTGRDNRSAGQPLRNLLRQVGAAQNRDAVIRNPRSFGGD